MSYPFKIFEGKGTYGKVWVDYDEGAYSIRIGALNRVDIEVDLITAYEMAERIREYTEDDHEYYEKHKTNGRGKE